MRNILIPAALAIILGSSGMAFAASTTAPVTKPAAISAMAASQQSIAGTVKAIDLKNHSLTLANGVSYVLPSTFKDPGLKVGEKVTVKYQMNGKAYDATAVSIG